MPSSSPGTLDALEFDNWFTRELPADPDTTNRPRQVENACFTRVSPTRASRPSRLAHSREVAVLLGLSEATCRSDEFAQVFSGNRQVAGMDPFAMCYGGHQFGHWAGQLGDGRAINLGQALATDGRPWLLQLKGAGPTPYSRSADGYAVVRSSVREFLCSEAMHHLGVPTTRALSLVTTGDSIVRDMFYDGHPRPEPGAVVCRVSRSFTRFGSFQIHAARGSEDVLRKLADATLAHDFPELVPASGELSRDVYVAWFREVCRRTLELSVHWARVGFVHGVMNTDNMSILGETIDYGPYGWLEGYDPGWTPNTTDASGRRYCFGSQPQIALWNLAQLGGALAPLVGDVAPLVETLEVFPARYGETWQRMMASKLGLAEVRPRDAELFEALLEVLQVTETDMTLFYRGLADLELQGEPAGSALDLEPLREAFYTPGDVFGDPQGDAPTRLRAWLESYRTRVHEDGAFDSERRARMNAVNPRYVLRNYLAQLAIDRAEEGDGALVEELLDVLRRPYDEQPDKARFAERRPEWARHKAGCSMLSCSS